jgi:glycosyltransferase involved in cell wall biosynthesis
VYNVEQYLRQCLDSVVNQTIRDIQIICVNDGSTDGSRAILQEYADRDSRIEIIHQQNQGGGSARNAAYPHIKGKYAYFADPDDWLDLHLCEKALRRIEETHADVVCFQAFHEKPLKTVVRPLFNPHFPDVRIASEHRNDVLVGCCPPWLKFWESSFLLHHHIRFSDGKRPFNDIFQHWKGCILADRIAILQEPLYFWRVSRPGSYQTVRDQTKYAIADTINQVETWLKESGHYDEYREFFQSWKLKRYYLRYLQMPSKYREGFRLLILDSLNDENRKFLQTASLQLVSRRVRHFYKMLEQQVQFIVKGFIHGLRARPRLYSHSDLT